MSTISAATPQTNPILSSNHSTVRQPGARDGDGDHGIEPTTSGTAGASAEKTIIPPGQPGAIINTTA
ncbi:MAG: hypothetical protein M0Z83_00275 [Betaproteobacteria bacterium]|nr:hypothetical protein [Betaproteobacteria bacterium]